MEKQTLLPSGNDEWQVFARKCVGVAAKQQENEYEICGNGEHNGSNQSPDKDDVYHAVTWQQSSRSGPAPMQATKKAKMHGMQ